MRRTWERAARSVTRVHRQLFVRPFTPSSAMALGPPQERDTSMTGAQPGFERRLGAALDATPSRIPVLLGGCGTGRTWLLQRVRERVGRSAVQYVDVERCATTPERFFQAVTSASPFPPPAAAAGVTTARQAFDALLAFFDSARGPGGEPCTFL